MKKYLALTALLCLGLLAGCASNKTTVTTIDANGKPVTVVTDVTDATLHNQARERVRLAALAAWKPVGKIVIPKGATLKAEGGDVTFEVNVPITKDIVDWAQYDEPWVQAGRSFGGNMLNAFFAYVLGFGDNYASKSNGPINYNVNAREGSGVNAWSPTGTANPATSVPTVVTQPAPLVVQAGQ